MEAFARASGVFNTVHLPGSIPSESPFEAPVVYGVLASLVAVSQVAANSEQGLRGLEATFVRPLRMGVGYDLEARRAPRRLTARVCDGDLPALLLDARISGAGRRLAVAGGERLQAPRQCPIEELAPGAAVAGRYAGDEDSLAWLRERFGLRTPTVGDGLFHALLFASYLVGMLIPGAGSLMSRLRVGLDQGTPPAGAGGAEPMSYRARVVDLQPQARMVTLAGELRHRGAEVAKLTCEVHMPPPPAPLDARLLEKGLGNPSNSLAGRAAIVIGAGRGLGVTLAHGLASQGCAVYACSRSGTEPEPSTGRWRGAIHQARGDASDPGYCRGLLREVVDRHGGLDFLVCCAAPPLQGIGFGPTSAGRFNEFVKQSVELVSVPMATMIDALQAREGACLVVSSAAVKTTPRDWGHYVAAKGAVEALAVWAAKRSPRARVLVARVPRLQGSSLVGEEGVAREAAAAWLVRRLSSGSGGGVCLLEWPDHPPPEAF
jgi:NADP-dependent 3-hydroxy acid dehydrogenase YdfG